MQNDSNVIVIGLQYFRNFPYEIRAGSSSKSAGGTIIKVERIIKHPENGIRFDNDVALLKLARPLQFGKTIKKIELANGETPAGTECRASGWGKNNISIEVKHSYDW